MRSWTFGFFSSKKFHTEFRFEKGFLGRGVDRDRFAKDDRSDRQIGFACLLRFVSLYNFYLCLYNFWGFFCFSTGTMLGSGSRIGFLFWNVEGNGDFWD